MWLREDLTEAVPEGKAFLAAAAHLGVIGFWSFLCQLCWIVVCPTPGVVQDHGWANRTSSGPHRVGRRGDLRMCVLGSV